MPEELKHKLDLLQKIHKVSDKHMEMFHQFDILNQRRIILQKAIASKKLKNLVENKDYPLFNPKIVRISIQETNYVPMLEWCSENTSDKWIAFTESFCFWDSIDASMFKLLFG